MTTISWNDSNGRRYAGADTTIAGSGAIPFVSFDSDAANAIDIDPSTDFTLAPNEHGCTSKRLIDSAEAGDSPVIPASDRRDILRGQNSKQCSRGALSS